MNKATLLRQYAHNNYEQIKVRKEQAARKNASKNLHSFLSYQLTRLKHEQAWLQKVSKQEGFILNTFESRMMGV